MPAIDVNEPNFKVPDARDKLAREGLAIGLTKFWSLVRDGKIGSIKIGKLVWIPDSAINKFKQDYFRPAVAVDEPKTPAIHKAARRKNAQKAAS